MQCVVECDNVHCLGGFWDGKGSGEGYAGSKRKKVIGAAQQHLLELLVQDCEVLVQGMLMAPALPHLERRETIPD